MAFLLTILGIAALVYVVVSALTYVNVTQLSKASLQAASDNEPAQREEQWAQENGFEFAGNHKMRLGAVTASISTWRRPDRPTFFCRYFIRAGNITKISHDFVTKFADDVWLTTAGTKDGHAIPLPPGAYGQSFSRMSFDDRWYQHIEAENYLMDKGKARLEADDTAFEEAFTGYVHRQTGYVRSLGLWPLRGPWWHFVRRQLWHDKSIRQQHERGMITLPCDLPATGSRDLLRAGQQ